MKGQESIPMYCAVMNFNNEQVWYCPCGLNEEVPDKILGLFMASIATVQSINAAVPDGAYTNT
jgi:hypothetical protein